VLQPGAQRANRSGVGHREPEVEEGRRCGGLRRGVQRQVETVGVADDHRAIGVRLRGGAVEPEVRRVEPQAALVVAHGQPEMAKVHGLVLLGEGFLRHSGGSALTRAGWP
jgi:hypothetical protein